jgi:2-hydroxy-3-keto-5-methylthiopentenyl-1-phosphate phosphatase
VSLRLFVEFEGTAAARDTGGALFDQLSAGANGPLVEAHRLGRLSARDRILREAALAGPVEPGALERFLDGEELDPGLPALALMCAERGWDLSLLSDGLDWAVDGILERHGIQRTARFANPAEFVSAGGGLVRICPTFPAQNPECGLCASCARNLMLLGTGDDDRAVYVGTRSAGICPAGYADLVFARGALQQRCQEENVSYLSFRTLHDVRAGLENPGGGLRKRHRARVKRQEAYRTE